MNATYRVSGYGPRAAHVCTAILSAIAGAIQSVSDRIARRVWVREYERAERTYWPVPRNFK